MDRNSHILIIFVIVLIGVLATEGGSSLNLPVALQQAGWILKLNPRCPVTTGLILLDAQVTAN